MGRVGGDEDAGLAIARRGRATDENCDTRQGGVHGDRPLGRRPGKAGRRETRWSGHPVWTMHKRKGPPGRGAAAARQVSLGDLAGGSLLSPALSLASLSALPSLCGSLLPLGESLLPALQVRLHAPSPSSCPYPRNAACWH